jgi:hypothetical protein
MLYWRIKKLVTLKTTRIKHILYLTRKSTLILYSYYTVSTIHFIPDMMMSLQNNNNYDLNHQRYTQTSSASQYSKKEEGDTPKKRDALDEFLKFWRPIIQKMK